MNNEKSVKPFRRRRARRRRAHELEGEESKGDGAPALSMMFLYTAFWLKETIITTRSLVQKLLT